MSAKVLAEGHSVWGISSKDSDNEGIKELLSCKNFSYSQCDISRRDEVRQLLDKNKSKTALIDAVILNAASSEEDINSGKFDYDIFAKIFNTNLLSAAVFIEKIYNCLASECRDNLNLSI